MDKIKKHIQEFIDKNILNTLSSRTIFVKENIDKIIQHTNFLPKTAKIKERLYIIMYDLTKKDIKCPICDKNKKFYTFTKGYNLTCSQSCSTTLINRNRDSSIYEKRKITYKNKTKDELKKISEKRHNTLLKKYEENYASNISKKSI